MLDKPSIKKILGTTNMEFKKNFIKIQILFILGLVGNSLSCSVYCDFSNNDGEVCASNGQTYKNRYRLLEEGLFLIYSFNIF